jgi:hypothetical protein
MKLQTVRIPFTNMSYTPDIPSSALGPNEYNVGLNVETALRGINSATGEIQILSQIPGNAIFITAGFRVETEFWFVVATVEGRWWAISGTTIVNVTPGYDPVTNPDAHIVGYSNNTTITDTWNGNVLFINDTIGPPMYLTSTAATFVMYSNNPLSTTDYIWNYNPAFSSLTAGWMRLYSTPNVGSILVAGNLTGTNLDNSTTQMPNTVRWSQAFGINSGPKTWAPTLTNVANELEVPVRGPVIDGFPCNGNFYVCSYWDTVVFQPLSYQSTNAPILGVRLFNVGRGLLNENCWANADNLVYGLDARDIWSFNGTTFKSLGNQRVRNTFFSNLNPLYTSLTTMINNTEKNQIEIYYADLTSTGTLNRMLAYRHDLDCWQAPRQINSGIHATEAPRVMGGTTGTSFNLASRGAVYIQGNTPNSRIIEKDIGRSFYDGSPIPSLWQRDNVLFAPTIPYNSEVLIHRILPEVVGGGTINITVGGAPSVGSQPTYQPTVTMNIATDQPWTQIDQNTYRAVSIKAENYSNTTGFQLTAITWQLATVSEAK